MKKSIETIRKALDYYSHYEIATGMANRMARDARLELEKIEKSLESKQEAEWREEGKD